MQLTQIQKLTGQIELVSGLHIGGSSTEMHIGGTDNPVINRPILNRELRELGSRGYLDAAWRAAIEQILAAHERAFAARRAFLLRVGFHSGAESMTLNGVRSIKINMGRDPQTGRTRYEDFATTKTVRLAAREIQQRRDLMPFGWLLVEAAPADQDFGDWPVGLTEQGLHEATAEAEWRAAVDARRRELSARDSGAA